MKEARVPPEAVEDKAGKAQCSMKCKVSEVFILLPLAPSHKLANDRFGRCRLLLEHRLKTTPLNLGIKTDENKIVVRSCPNGPKEEGDECECEEGGVCESVFLLLSQGSPARDDV